MHYPVSSKLFVKNLQALNAPRCSLRPRLPGFPTRLKLRFVAKPPQMIGIFSDFTAAANIPLAAELTARLGWYLMSETR
jgi:hypothetical protein